jgi:hypothetical protein
MVLHIVGLEVVYSICSLRAAKVRLCERQQGRVAKPVCNHHLAFIPTRKDEICIIRRSTSVQKKIRIPRNR